MMTEEQYVAEKGSRCPFCGSTEFEGHEVTIEEGRAFQEISCHECNNSWFDIYELVGFEPGEE